MQNNSTTFSSAETIVLVHSGDDYSSRLEGIILSAKTEIHIQTYIFEIDTIGKKILKALEKAASQGVKIYILIDGFGSFSFPIETMNELEKNNIGIRVFSPFFSANSLYIGRRLHHKIIVVDAEIALIGGINISDKYYGTPNTTPWLDYALQINDEKIAKLLEELCRDIYFKKRIIRRKEIKTIFETTKKIYINVLQNDWLKRKNEIFKSYITNIGNAKKEIIIVGSYFLPGRKLANTLKKASEKGVTVKLILSGISDIPMARRASCHLYSKLLQYNIELFEWKNSVLHGKVAVIDNHWTTIGSFNLNNLSSYASIEMNVSIISAEFSNKFHLHLEKIMTDCEKITPETLKLRAGFSAKLINWASYWVTRIIEIIITYLPHKRFRRLY